MAVKHLRRLFVIIPDIRDDQEMLTRLEQLVEENLGNEQFGVGDLSRSVGISRSHLHRKLKAATGQSVSQFIREYRLRKALDLLKEGQHTVSEVAYRLALAVLPISAGVLPVCMATHPVSQAKSSPMDKRLGHRVRSKCIG